MKKNRFIHKNEDKIWLTNIFNPYCDWNDEIYTYEELLVLRDELNQRIKELESTNIPLVKKEVEKYEKREEEEERMWRKKEVEKYEKIMKDKKHPKYKEAVLWLGKYYLGENYIKKRQKFMIDELSND